MEQEKKALSERALLLKKLQKKSFCSEENKIKKWVARLQHLSINSEELNTNVCFSQDIYDEVTEKIFKDLIR